MLSLKPRSRFRPKSKRLPSRRAMTVCIAAACQESAENDSARIVFCCDWRGEVEQVGSADTVMKFRHLSEQWVALMAGDVSRAEELCIRYEVHLKTTNFTQANIADEVRQVFNAYKKSLADSYLQATFGISFDDLITKGRDKLGDQFVETCLDQIARLKVGAELIIAGITETYDFAEKQVVASPLICSVSESQEDPLCLETEFAVVGSGGNAAKTMLFWREQDSSDPLMETIYAVYEAKQISETVPGVGPSFFLAVLYPDNTVLELSDDGYTRCKELFAKFGPKSRDVKLRKEWFAFMPDYLEPLTPPKPLPPSPDPTEKP
jgi:hypothetical protein